MFAFTSQDLSQSSSSSSSDSSDSSMSSSRTSSSKAAATTTATTIITAQHLVAQRRSSSSSSPISLPSTHIRRTPSELQFAADTIHAEYKDGVMYSRLMRGMHRQILQREAANNTAATTDTTNDDDDGGGAAHHPSLSWKSLQGVLKTKMADDRELMMEHQGRWQQQQHYRCDDDACGHFLDHGDGSVGGDDDDDDDNEWQMAHDPVGYETVYSSSLASSSQGSASFTSRGNDGSKDSLSSLCHDFEESVDLEDDCIFSFEL